MVYMCIQELMPATVKYIKAQDAAISNLIGMFIMFISVYYLHGMLPHSHTPLYDTSSSSSSTVLCERTSPVSATLGSGNTPLAPSVIEVLCSFDRWKCARCRNFLICILGPSTSFP